MSEEGKTRVKKRDGLKQRRIVGWIEGRNKDGCMGGARESGMDG